MKNEVAQIHPADKAPSVLPFPWIKRIFQRLGAMYGERFHKQWGNIPSEEVIPVWAEALGGYSVAEISAGLEACKLHEWPPTLPEFLRLCRPWMNPEVAYHEAVKGMVARSRGEIGNWSHPAVYWAAVAVGSQTLLSSTYGSIKAVWDKAFSEEMAKGQWNDIPVPVSALPAPGQTQATKEEAEATLKRLGATKIFDQQEASPRRWIAKLEERIANGHVPTHAIMQMLEAAKEKTA